ncbi:MAG: TonB-dependent receptor plug domain-containing protein [Muribaculaceae bacterium]|nr:TonB-dependent receptor plug domain-containing protein [Muribaculaceae bacterium]MDE5923966.1 TonB-dependent receptor plug domain-containing protein [Muribaculaceae bacterium]
MVKKIGVLSLGLLAMSATAAAEEPNDSIAAEELKEVVVTGNSARQRFNNSRIGAERLELSKMIDLPAFGGEVDIIKSITLLPGVRSEGEGGGGFEVRGGNAYQNLVLLDGISLYNPSHVMGIFSTFNDNAIGGVTLYKGTIPAMYGDATSSVLETTLAAGDMEEYQGSATIGILAAKIKADGPIVKDKLSFAVAARRSYVDAFLKIIPEYRSTIMNFYDVSAKLRYRPSSCHMIDGTFFISHDNMAIADLMGLYWGNLGGSLNWTARANDRLTFTTTAALTHFEPKMAMDIMDLNQVMWTYIHNYSINERMRWQIAERQSLEFGIRSELLRVKSAEWMLNESREREIRSMWENSVWAEYAGSFADRFDVTAGMRLNVASALSQRRFHEFQTTLATPNQFDGKTYIEAEPRVNLKYNLTPLHNVKAGFGISTQCLHAIRSSTTSFPFDRYALTSAVVKPERSLQYGVGYGGMTESGEFDWSAEGYFRSMNNVYDFMDGRTTFSDIAIESIILGGRGRCYGAEFMLRKNTGRLTGWVAYTISRTETKIPGINDGRWYNATNDRRHDFSITAIYQLSDSWNLSGSWIFLSGQPLTAPDVKYEIGGATCYYYSKRNSYMTPPTHRLDLSAKYTHVGKKLTYEWAFGVYNTYCRYNPYVVYFEDDSSKPSGTRAVLRAMYGIVPSVSYTLKF